MVLKCVLHQRYVFAIMGFLVTLVAYMMQISLDLTLPHMVTRTITPKLEKFDTHSCPKINLMPNQTDFLTIEEVKPGPYDWDEYTQKSLLSIFKTSYIITQLPGGMMADRHGGKKILGIGFLVLSTCTLIIPFGCKLLGPTAITILRFISGLASGIIIPVFISMMSRWAPTDERALMSSLIFPGTMLGFVTGSYLSELIVNTAGWEAVYYLFGLMGLILCLLWKKLVYSTPNEHPNISDSEKKYLNENLTSLKRIKNHDLDPLPWKAFIRSGAVWGTIIGFNGQEWAFNTVFNQMPLFLKDVLRVDVAFSPLLLYMPIMCTWLGALLFGFICDIFIKKKICSVKNARITLTGIGSIGAAISIIVVMYSGCEPVAILFWSFVGMMVCGAYYCGCIIGALEFAPNYAGSVSGAAVNLALNASMLLPVIKDMIVTDALLSQWRISFWVVIFYLVITFAGYVYFIKTDQEWWDDIRQYGYPENWKHGLVTCEGYIDENGESTFNDRKDVDLNKTRTSE